MRWNVPFPFRRPVKTTSPRLAPSQQADLSPTVATPIAIPQESIFISRQPIFDATEKIRAFQLLIRAGGMLPESEAVTSDEATHLVLHTLSNFGIAEVLGEHVGFIPLPYPALVSDLVELLPKQKFVLECGAAIQPPHRINERCGALQTMGFSIARTISDSDDRGFPPADTFEYLIYDLAQLPLSTIVRLDRASKLENRMRLIRNVNTRADFEACKAVGFDLYQGNYFAQCDTLSGHRVDPTRARVLEILNLVMNKADPNAIEAAFKHDVALCYSLLCYINSVGVGLPYKAASIKNAIMLMGYDFLWRWLSLLVYAGIDLSAGQRVLLHTAIIRGRLTELLGQTKLPEKEANALFVVGIFSLLDALLGVPLEQALARINLPRDIARALTHQDGPYAAYFELALAFETQNSETAQNLCETLNISLADASKAHLSAMEWAGALTKN